MDEPLRCPPPTLGRVMQLVRANDAESLDLLRKSHPTEFAALLGQQQREVEEGKTAIVQLLLSWGADPHLQLSNGDTALTIACARNRLIEARLLLAAGVNPNIAGSYGVPALWHACLMGSVDLVNALLDANADVNLTCSRGTPLQAACLRASPEILHRLLIAGARSDPTVPTCALLLPWRNVSLLRRLMQRGVKVSVDLEGEPLALIHSITEMAKDPENFLSVMGMDALDTFLPFVIDMQLRAADRAQKEKREQARLDELRRAGHLDDRTDVRPRRTTLALPAIMLHPHEGDDQPEGNGDDNGDDGADNGGDEDMDGREASESDEEESESESAEAVARAKPKRTLRARRRILQQSIRNRLRLNLASRRNRLRGGRR